MDNFKKNKRNKLFEKYLSIIFQKESSKLELNGGMVTVTSVRIAPDMKTGKVYLSFFGFIEKKNEDILKMLQRRYRFIHQLLWQKARHQIRVLPQLTFYIDDTEQEARRIEHILKNLNIPKADE